MINSKYLLTVNYMPGPVLGAGDKAMKRQPGTPSHGTYKSTGRRVTAKYRDYPVVPIVLGVTLGKQRVLRECVRGLVCLGHQRRPI